MATLIEETTCEAYEDLPHWLLAALIPGKFAVRIRDDLSGVEFLEILDSSHLSHPEDILDFASYIDLRCVKAYRPKIPQGSMMLISACEMFPINKEDFKCADELEWDIELELVDEWVYRGILSLKEVLH